MRTLPRSSHAQTPLREARRHTGCPGKFSAVCLFKGTLKGKGNEAAPFPATFGPKPGKSDIVTNNHGSPRVYKRRPHTLIHFCDCKKGSEP